MHWMYRIGRHSVSKCTSLRQMSTEKMPTFKNLEVTIPMPKVYHVQLNRPQKLNSMNKEMWGEIGECFNELDRNSDCRAIVLSANGKIFTAGIDLADLAEMGSIVTSDKDVARKCKLFKQTISKFQDDFSALEKCSKPVIAAVHGACVGAGIDMISSADIRYCAQDAWFQVKEVEVGLAADVGTLQRLPKVIGSESLVRELCFTARKFYADEALQSGFVSRILPDKEKLIKCALEVAFNISEKSPVAVQATKECLIHSRDHSVQESLDYMATLNSTLLQSSDLMTSAMAMMNKQKPTFDDL